MTGAARCVGLAAALGGLVGLVDALVRGMGSSDALAAAGWCAIAAGGVAVLGAAACVGIAKAWPTDAPGLAFTRAGLASVALGTWAATLVVLGDRFAVRFSAIDLAALLWAVVGLALAMTLALVVEPLARGLAPRLASVRLRPRMPTLVAIALGVAALGACAAALVRGSPKDPGSLGAMAARGLGGR